MGLIVKGGKTPGVKKPGVNYGHHLTTQPVTGKVSSAKSVAGTVVAETLDETTTVHPGVFTDGMSITVTGGRTLNLGNYESAKVSVSLTVPCDTNCINEAYDWATSWVSNRIEIAVAQAKKA